MNDNQKRNLEALSSIDEKIVEWSGKKRATLKSGGGKRTSKRKWYIIGGSAAAAVALMLSTVLILVSVLSGQTPPVGGPPVSGGKQVPVYQGMTVSNTLALDATSQFNDNGNGNDNSGDNGNHYGHYKGDYKQDQEIPEGEPFPEKPLSGSLTVLGGDDGYYAMPGESIYITVHLSNPDKFEILSFTLNGEKYSSYMFESGSDLENLILKVKVGQVEGMISYTIDAIKYVDGEEIKDVRMDGDKTVEVGVYTEKQPTVTVNSQTVGFNSVSFALIGTDEMKLIESSNGKVEALLYNGDSIVARKEVSLLQGATVSFDDLAPNTLYQYAIVASYDALDGKGFDSYILFERAFYTEAPLLFDGVTLSSTGIAFDLLWHEKASGSVQSITLASAGGTQSIAPTVTSIGDLLPATDYILTLTYKNGDRTEEIVLEFTTAPLTYTVNHLMEQLDGSYAVAESFTDVIALGATATPEVQTHEGFTSPAEIAITGQTGTVLEVNYYYERTTYTLTLVRNDGSEADTLSLKYGHEIPGDTGEGFGGWFRDADLTEAVTTVPAESLTLYAKWENATSPELLTYTGVDVLTITGVREGVTLTELKIPAYIGGKRVVAVAESAFAGAGHLLSVEFPDTMLELGRAAFQNCTGLTEMVIPDSVEKIGDHLLSGCSSIESLTIPFVGQMISTANDTHQYPFGYIFGSTRYTGGVAAQSYYYGSSLTTTTSATNYIPEKLKSVTVTGGYILHGAFQGCSTLTNVKLPANLTEIGRYAFRDCTGLTSIELPAGLISIGNGSFNGSGLTSITVPEGVTSLDQYAFAHCADLKVVVLPKSLQSIQQNTFYNTPIETATVPAVAASFIPKSELVSVTVNCGSVLPANAFNGALKLSFVRLPSEMTAIDTFAFGSCEALTSIDLPNGLLTIGDSAFEGCTSLLSLTIPENMKNIGAFAFADCTALRSVFFNAKAMEDLNANVFSAAGTAGEGIAVTIGAGVTRVPAKLIFRDSNGERASVSSITFAAGSVCTEIGQSAFEFCKETALVLPQSLQTVGKAAFYGNDLLRSVSIPASLINIEASAFAHCDVLETVSFAENAKLETIGVSAFVLCPMLDDVVLPGSLKSIGGSAFASCSSLSAITIPSSVTSIGGSAFNSCTALKTAEIKGNIGTLENSTFQGCTSLTSVVISGQITAINKQAFYGCTLLDTVVLPAGLEQIGQKAFYNCTALSDVTLRAGLLKIGYECFYNCTSLTGIVLPETLTTVEGFAFYNTGLTSVTIPASVTSIYAQAFENCTSLASVQFKGNQISRLYYGLFRGCTKLESIAIPASVTAFADYVFSGCTSLKEITIPKAVGSIGKEVFYECTSLSTLTFEEGSALTTVGANAFTGCPIETATIPAILTTAIPKAALKSATVNSGTALPANAFKDASVLTSVTLCNSLQSIGDHAFDNCKQLTEINIPQCVISIGASAFSGCTALSRVNYMGTYVDDWARIEFANAAANPLSLTGGALYIDGENVTEGTLELSSMEGIGSYAFYGCTDITELNIHAGAKSVGAYAFYGCTGITDLSISVGVTVDTNAFVGCQISKAIVPMDAVSKLNKTTLQELEILDGTRLADKALQNYTALRIVKIPNSVISMGSALFSGCGKLEEMTIPFVGSQPQNSSSSQVLAYTHLFGYVFGGAAYEGGVKTVQTIYDGWEDDSYEYYLPQGLKLVVVNGGALEQHAFSGCQIDQIVLNDGVTNISHGAFENSGIKQIRLPSTLQSLSYDVFWNCKNLTEITIPAATTYIGPNLFVGCGSLRFMTVEAGNPKYHSQGNCIIETETKTLIEGCAGSVIPDDGSVLTIGSSAFEGRTGAQSITIPACITIIGNSAFQGSGFTEILFADGSQCTTIYSNAFAYSAIKQMELPEGLTSIDYRLFESCSYLTNVTIPESVTSICGDAFRSCIQLSSIVLPKGLIEIGDDAFSSCIKLLEVYNLSDTLTLELGSTANGSVACYAVAIHTSLDAESVYLTDPNGFVFVQKNGVYYLVQYTGTDRATVVLPDNYKGNAYYVGEGAFIYDTELVSLTIPANVLGLGEMAFGGCVNLKEIYFNATNMADCGSFNENGVLDTIVDPFYQAGINSTGITFYVGANVQRIPAFLFYDYFTMWVYHGNEEELYAHLPNVKAVVFADNSQCKSIGEYAFATCIRLESVDFGDNSALETIALNAFSACVALKEVVIPASVTRIEAGFAGCDALVKATFECTEGWITGGDETPVDLTDPVQNAILLTDGGVFVRITGE